MTPRRAAFVIEVDLDPIPGFGHTPESWKTWLERTLSYGAEHYRPTVTPATATPDVERLSAECAYLWDRLADAIEILDRRWAAVGCDACRHGAGCRGHSAEEASSINGHRVVDLEGRLADIEAALVGDDQAVLKVAAAQQVLIDPPANASPPPQPEPDWTTRIEYGRTLDALGWLPEYRGIKYATHQRTVHVCVEEPVAIDHWTYADHRHPVEGCQFCADLAAKGEQPLTSREAVEQRLQALKASQQSGRLPCPHGKTGPHKYRVHPGRGGQRRCTGEPS